MSGPRRRDERWTYYYSGRWRDPRIKALGLEADHLLLCLAGGSMSTRAGIFLYYHDAIAKDFEYHGSPGSRDRVEPLLDELAHHGFIVRDHDVLWIVRQLEDDPGIPSRDDPALAETVKKLSDKTLKGIRYDLSRVPSTSPVVRKFRRYYAYLLGEGATQGPRREGRRGVPQGAEHAPNPHPNPDPHPITASASETEKQPPDFSSSSSNGSNGNGASSEYNRDFEAFRTAQIAAGVDRGLLEARKRYTPGWRELAGSWVSA